MPPSDPGHGSLVGLVVELVAWLAVCVAVWMASLSAWSAHDFVVAVACAAPCTVAAAAARRAVKGRWRPPRRLWRWLALFPLAVATELVVVLVSPLRRWRSGGSVGEFRTIRVVPKRSAGNRALVALLLSSTPGSYVVATDPDEGTALLHSVGAASALERAIAR